MSIGRWICRGVALTGIVWGGMAMAVEEARYTVIERDGRFELRDYEPQILAETWVDGSLEDAGNRAFNRLFKYISGNNTARAKLAMTAPVGQEAAGTKIPMTAPVAQEAAEGGWVVTFMMPAGATFETLPTPDDPAVTLRAVPARRMAAVRYSGTWSARGYERHLAALKAWILDKGLTITAPPIWARYNPPFTPWFWRRNEVLIPVQ